MFVSTFNWEELSKRGWIPTRRGYSLIWVKWAVKRSTDKTVLGGTVLGGYLVWGGGFSKSVIFTSVERPWSAAFTASQLPVCIVLYLCWTVTQSGTTQINWEESFFDVYLAKSMLVVFFSLSVYAYRFDRIAFGGLSLNRWSPSYPQEGQFPKKMRKDKNLLRYFGMSSIINYYCRKSLVLNFKLQFFPSSTPFVLFCFREYNSNLDFRKLAWTFFAYFCYLFYEAMLVVFELSFA